MSACKFRLISNESKKNIKMIQVKLYMLSLTFSIASSNSLTKQLLPGSKLLLDTIDLFNLQLTDANYVYAFDSSFYSEFEQLESFFYSTGKVILFKGNNHENQESIQTFKNYKNHHKDRKFVFCISQRSILKQLLDLLNLEAMLKQDSLRHQVEIYVITKKIGTLNVWFDNMRRKKFDDGYNSYNHLSKENIQLVEPLEDIIDVESRIPRYVAKRLFLFNNHVWDDIHLADWEWIDKSITNLWRMGKTKSRIEQIQASETLTKSSPNSTLKKSYLTSGKERKHIVIAAIEVAPFMMLKSDNIGNVHWEGYCMDFFNKLIEHLPYNISYEIYQAPDNKFGTKISKLVIDRDNASQKVIESWTGLIGELDKGRADLALAPLVVMKERELVIDFTVPFYDLVGIQILLKKPEVSQDWFKFLTVLDNEVWLFIFVAYIITAFVMFVFDRFSPYSHKNKTSIERIRRKFDEMNKNSFEKSDHPSNIANNRVEPINLLEKRKERAREDLKHFNGHFNQFHDTKVSTIIDRGIRTTHGNLDSPLKSSDRITIHDYPYPPPFYLNVKHEPQERGDIMYRQRKRSSAFGDYIQGIKSSHHHRSNRHSSISHNADCNSDTNSSSESIELGGKPDFSFKDSLWFCITSLTPQGGGEAPQNLSGKVVAGAWWLFCFIVTASYTANLAAFLTVSRLDIPIKSLDDLSKQYKIKYAPVAGTAEQTYFERMAYIEEVFYNIWKDMSLNDSMSEEEQAKLAVWDYPISDKYTKMWNQIQQVGMPTSVDIGVNRVRSSSLDDGFALLADANLVKYAVMTDCSLKAVGDEMSRKPIALGVRKGDETFREHLSYAILQLINQRYMEVLREIWWTNNPNKVSCIADEESEGMSVENFGGVFFIVLVGVILSFMVWAIEQFMYKTRKELSKQHLLRHRARKIDSEL